MSLRDRAEAEVAEATRRAIEEAEERRQKRLAERDRLTPHAAGWLHNWSGEDVGPDDLEPADAAGGPPRWRITLDGFDLEVIAGMEPGSFQLLQLLPDGDGRSIRIPGELLAPRAAWPNGSPFKPKAKRKRSGKKAAK